MTTHAPQTEAIPSQPAAAARSPKNAGRALRAPRPQGSDDLARVLKLRVPIIVQLARRTLPISIVRELSVGAIIEFEKAVDDPLDLQVNNRTIGTGVCVKVGENFGLRVNQICDRAERVRSMGR